VEEYKVGDMVLLSTKELKCQMISRRADKLTERFVGPYKVKEIISSNAIELELPSSIRIHPVVNVSRICRYRDQVKGQKVTPPPPVEIQGEMEYKVEKILSKRKRYGNVINQLDPIEELYEMYLEGEEDTPRIVEVGDNRLNFDSDLEDGPADPYLEL